MKREGRAPSKLSLCIEVPRRALIRARDFYVNTMMDCADRRSQSAVVVGMPSGQSHSFVRSRSRSAGGEDVDDGKKFMRAASTRSTESGSTKSRSTEIMRIDEHKPCYFDGDIGLGYPKRIKSRAIPTTNETNVMVFA